MTHLRPAMSQGSRGVVSKRNGTTHCPRVSEPAGRCARHEGPRGQRKQGKVSNMNSELRKLPLWPPRPMQRTPRQISARPQHGSQQNKSQSSVCPRPVPAGGCVGESAVGRAGQHPPVSVTRRLSSEGHRVAPPCHSASDQGGHHQHVATDEGSEGWGSPLAPHARRRSPAMGPDGSALKTPRGPTWDGRGQSAHAVLTDPLTGTEGICDAENSDQFSNKKGPDFK